MSVASMGATCGSVRSASRATSVSATMFFFSTVTSSVSACANASTSADCTGVTCDGRRAAVGGEVAASSAS